VSVPPASCRAALARTFSFLLVCAAATGAETKTSCALRWVSNGTVLGWTLEVTGVPAESLDQLRHANWTVAQWQKAFVVHAEQGEALGTVGMPAMSGTYQAQGDGIRFVPQFPLEPGVNYIASLFTTRLPGPRAGVPIVTTEFRLSRPASSPSTVVTQIYPSADVLPENLLKFYVHFSAPMSRGHIYEHIHLRDEAGRDVELPFLEIDEELWNPDLTRLTLFIDPGRIKRGVQPLEEVGPALAEGKRYTLALDAPWKDGHGLPLKAGFQKTFRVGAPDREAVQPARWKIAAPRANTRDPLTIQFGEPMDHALASRVIHVTDAASRSVAGTVQLRDHEREWSFTPVQPWHSGAHSLLVQNTIEDIAGNNIGKTFEVDLFEGIQRRFTNATVKLPFQVGQASLPDGSRGISAP